MALQSGNGIGKMKWKLEMEKCNGNWKLAAWHRSATVGM